MKCSSSSSSSLLRLSDLLPELSVSDEDQEMLRDLASNLVTHNLEQSNMLLVTKKGFPKSNTGQWKEMRRKDGLRIYRERPGSTRSKTPFTPSLLLLGTVDGTVEDVMYGVVANTDAAMKINSTYVNDGMLDTKILCELVEPSREDPFCHAGIKWKLFSDRDYVSLDTTGILCFSNGERIGDSILISNIICSGLLASTVSTIRAAEAVISRLERHNPRYLRVVRAHSIPMKAQDLAHYYIPPKLNLSESDVGSLRELADTLVTHNIESYRALLVSSDGHADARQWKELRRKDDIRVYKERPAAYATSGSTLPRLPSLLLLGTVVGKLEDVMFVAAAATDEQMKLTSRCLQDGVLDSKVLQSIVRPTDDHPFRHVGVKWRLHDARDYVCLDTTGIATSCNGEQLGFSISHSVAFAKIPSLDKFGIERANMSVCCLFRQKTPETVECYARGFFDFRSNSNELLNTLSMNAVATQWLSFSRYVVCADMKKLVWRMRKNWGLPVNGPMAIEPVDEHATQSANVEKSSNGCSVCNRSHGFSLRRTCKICQRGVCSSCNVKKLVCVLAPDRRTVLDKKRSFCTMCMYEVTRSDAVSIARDEIRELQSPEPQDDEPETTADERIASIDKTST
ncbi:hypothetical protein JG687_00009739 [Phytophthora cactorum]|uniref:FYVE-type domain-containing protein n=1 Tax=Phytophthora cactorum TaxID=29920 RepID=A0A8T1UEA2_9STRA|nr:hypothetical protein JG687_00009739 [Phytophthora cactorum]